MNRPVGRKKTTQRPDIILVTVDGLRRYYDLARLVDAGVGRVLREVEEVSPRNVTVIRPDHGEALGERPSLQRDAEWFATDGRRYDHGYPEQIEANLIRTPRLVKLPGQRRGASPSSWVSALDLFASLLELSAEKIK